MNKAENFKKAVDNLSRSQCETPVSQCPHCKKSLDRARSADTPNVKPRPGDCTICAYCRNILEFDQSLSLIPATETTLRTIAGTESLMMSTELAAIIKGVVAK